MDGTTLRASYVWLPDPAVGVVVLVAAPAVKCKEPACRWPESGERETERLEYLAGKVSSGSECV